jgi:hypothetical protein
MADTPSAVVGWRAWRLDLAGGTLRSIAADASWKPGVNDSVCLTRGTGSGLAAAQTERCREPPGIGCTCGFWALWDLGQLVTRERWADINAGQATRQRVIGLMAGTGIVALHGSEGFRSQRARVVALFRDQHWERDLDGLLERSSRWAFAWFGLGQRLRARRPSLSGIAELYGVPLLTLADAAAWGVLRELGLAEEQDRKVRSQLRFHGSHR